MTPHLEHKPHIRELIRSFARIDECFDDDLHFFPRKKASKFQILNANLEFLLSFSLYECDDSTNDEMDVLTQAKLRQVVEILPGIEQSEDVNPFELRQTLRDKLYEFLLRMDHCTNEQLLSRAIVLPQQLQLSLMQLQQLVLYMISECLEDLDKRRRDRAEPAM